MIETRWPIYVWNGNEYVADGYIPSPNKEFTEKLASTKKAVQLVDGTECLKGPENKFLRDQISFSWSFKSKNELKEKIQNYVRANSRVKIACKEVSGIYDGEFFSDGSEIEGEFLNVQSRWIIGTEGNTQFYEITASFKVYNT